MQYFSSYRGESGMRTAWAAAWKGTLITISPCCWIWNQSVKRRTPVQWNKYRIFVQKIDLKLAQCLKITEKVSFKIASEASYVYILSGQKLIKNAKMVHFGEFLKTWSLRSNSVTRQVSFNRTKIGGKCQNSKIQWDILSNFQTMCSGIWTKYAPFASYHSP